MIQTRKSYMLWTQQHNLGYSRLHIFRRSWTARQLRLRIYELLRPLLQSIPKVSKLNKRGKQLSRAQIIESEYDAVFTDSRGEYRLDNPLYDIEIHNNLPADNSMIFSRCSSCDFCGLEHKDNCMFAF